MCYTSRIHSSCCRTKYNYKSSHIDPRRAAIVSLAYIDTLMGRGSAPEFSCRCDLCSLRVAVYTIQRHSCVVWRHKDKNKFTVIITLCKLVAVFNKKPRITYRKSSNRSRRGLYCTNGLNLQLVL